MKRLLPLLLVATAAPAQDEIPYGIEVLTGYRSEYIDRGFSLAQDLLEVQLGTEIAINDDWRLELGGWYEVNF
jgi:hypothetical protein